MKNSRCFIIWLLSLAYSFNAIGQDSLSIEDLQKYSYSFKIENGIFHGKGAEILTTAIANAHITMLGDNYQSKLESEFTNALISELDRNHYKTMVVETGNASGIVLNQLSEESTQIVPVFKALNQQYGIGKKENPLVPIPDFKSVEAAQYLQTAIDKDWATLAIGTESWTSYKMLVNALYENLSIANQQAHQSLYQTVLTFLDTQSANISTQNNADVLAFTNALKSSNIFNEFLERMANFKQNQPIIKAMQFSINHWQMYGNKEFYKKNKLQAKRNKVLLAETLNNNKFDFQKDKLFIKMFVNHLAKGTTVSGFFGVGNMLQELTEYHGHNSLNIAIARRFYEDKGVVKDIMDSPSFKYINFQDLIPLGQKEDWILIDLRPFNEVFFFKGKAMSVAMHKIISRYDMLVIPKMDSRATINY